MAKSESQKKLAHKLRQGKPNPNDLRGSWNGVIPVTKKIPNKKKEVRANEDYSH